MLQLLELYRQIRSDRGVYCAGLTAQGRHRGQYLALFGLSVWVTIVSQMHLVGLCLALTCPLWLLQTVWKVDSVLSPAAEHL